ncbi:MAG: hypothetical protein QM627_05250 [Luteolibacter sp.]
MDSDATFGFGSSLGCNCNVEVNLLNNLEKLLLSIQVSINGSTLALDGMNILWIHYRFGAIKLLRSLFNSACDLNECGRYKGL